MEKENPNLNELLKDIRHIKNAVKQNSYAFRQMIYLPLFKLSIMSAGLTATLIPLLYYFFLQRYGNYTSIPSNIRWFLFAGIGLGLGLTTFWKSASYFRLWQFIPQSSFFKNFIRLISRQAITLYPVLFGITIFFVVFFITQRSYHLLVPAMAIGLGICFSMIGSFISLTEFFLFGSYICISGTISVPFIIETPRVSLLWASGIFGLGMLIFGFYLMFFHRVGKENEDGTA